jgi:ABC-2 type transport system permease protein
MISLYKKELTAYFGSPFGFVFLGVFMLISGIMFTIYNLLGANSGLAGMFDLLRNFSFILFPTLTMRMFAEERRTGAEQMLMTSRLSIADIVLGKFFAAFTVFLSAMAGTLVYVGIVIRYGSPSAGSLAASYLGFIVLGMAMIAICTFTSSFAENQITAAVASFWTLFFLVLLSAFTRSLQIPIVTPVLRALAITVRYDEFTRGILSPGPLVYYLAVTCLALLYTVKALELRRLR